MRRYINYVGIIITFCFNYSRLKKRINNSDFIIFLPFYHTGGAEKVHVNIIKAIKGFNYFIFFTDFSSNDHFKKDFFDNDNDEEDFDEDNFIKEFLYIIIIIINSINAILKNIKVFIIL